MDFGGGCHHLACSYELFIGIGRVKYVHVLCWPVKRPLSFLLACFTVCSIVKDRRVQKNFQLIVITHDSEFVDMLGRSQFVDDFYEVSKNRE